MIYRNRLNLFFGLEAKPEAKERSHTTFFVIAFFAILVTTWAIYQPAIPGSFMLDDFDNLSVLEEGVVDWESLRNYLNKGNAGPLGRPLAKLTFLINDNGWPSNPDTFKRFNLLLHLLCGLAIFVMGRLLLRTRLQKQTADWLALVATALWLVHPLQVSTVMYVVQRMTQLSSFFVLTGIVSHLYLRTSKNLTSPTQLLWLTVSLSAFTLLAAFSKESGALLPTYLLVVELTILAGQQNSPMFVWWRRICLALPTVSIVAYLSYLPRWLPGYAPRNFTLLERLLTQPVILLDYLTTLVTMQVSGLGLFHDDYKIYSSILDPITALASAVILGAAALAIVYRKRYPFASFGILWFLAGHLIESTTVPLELYFEHRNYLPVVGPIVALATVSYSGLGKVSDNIKKLVPVAGLLFACVAATITYGYAGEWGNLARLLPIWAAEHPESPRAQRTYAQLLASQGLPEAALDELDRSYERFPEDISFPVISIDISCAFDVPLRYDLRDLAKQTQDHRWTDGLRPALQSLYGRILETSCREKTADLHHFVSALPRLKLGEHRRSGIASFFVLDGDLYVKEGNARGALQSYRIVDQLVPSPGSALRITQLFIQSGNYKAAKEVLKVAQARHNGNRSEEYAEKFALIDRLAAARNNENDSDGM